MSFTLNQDLATRILSQVSRSFYLTLKLLPAPMRQPVSLGYLVARFSDTLADTEALSHEIRIQSLEAFEKILLEIPHVSDSEFQFKLDSYASDLEKNWIPLQNHAGERALLQSFSDLLQAWAQLSQNPELKKILLEVWTPIIQGQKEDLLHFPNASLHALPTRESLWHYTWQVAGCVGLFWTQIGIETMGKRFIVTQDEQKLHDQAIRCGQALQLVNILRDLPKDLQQGRCYLPLEEIHEEGLTLEEVSRQPSKLENSARVWISHAEKALESCPEYIASLQSWRIRWATALPFALAILTLQKLQSSTWSDWENRVKVPRKEVLRLMKVAWWKTRQSRPAKAWLEGLLKKTN